MSTVIIFNFIEPVKLIGEGKYNINSIREIKVTKSYLGLRQSVRGCQDGEPILDCTTRLYIDTALNLCGCLPLSMRTDMKVRFKRIKV